jgi:hypothetical protein
MVNKTSKTVTPKNVVADLQFLKTIPLSVKALSYEKAD